MASSPEAAPRLDFDEIRPQETTSHKFPERQSPPTITPNSSGEKPKRVVRDPSTGETYEV